MRRAFTTRGRPELHRPTDTTSTVTDSLYKGMAKPEVTPPGVLRLPGGGQVMKLECLLQDNVRARRFLLALLHVTSVTVH